MHEQTEDVLLLYVATVQIMCNHVNTNVQATHVIDGGALIIFIKLNGQRRQHTKI